MSPRIDEAMTTPQWTAVVLAGERPGEDNFASACGVTAKALIPVGGEPMLSRVVHVLLTCPRLDRIIILAQDPDRLLGGDLGWMHEEGRIGTAVSGDGISRSILAIAGETQTPFPILLVTADHPLLTPAMVEHFIGSVGEADAAVGVVERRTVEAAYPTTKRTWLRFSDGAFSGANLFALRTPDARRGLELWSEVERNRKKALRLLLHFGPLLALRAITRTISLERAVQIAGRRSGFDARPVRLPFAEAAIDVDKLEDLALAEAILARRPAGGA
ncbi:MAG: hypothetical protein JWN69_866 [Alphaproteobacteria bacterium]|nr:hypothetical protein [Alphaproteobacteria bacterium]